MGTVISNHIWKMLGPTLCLMLFPLAISCLHVTESPVTCASNNTACDLHGDGFIDFFTGVEDIAECREICNNVDGCEFITFFGPDGFPLRDICQLFHSCDETLSCTECISETKHVTMFVLRTSSVLLMKICWTLYPILELMVNAESCAGT